MSDQHSKHGTQPSSIFCQPFHLELAATSAATPFLASSGLGNSPPAHASKSPFGTKRSKSNAAESAANYRSTALRAVEEIEGAYVNLSRRRGQLASIERERVSAKTAWQDAQSKTQTRAGSFADENSISRNYRNASCNAASLRLQILDDYLALVRALGG